MPKEIILLLGSGGREHALDAALSSSPLTERVYVAPGNGGIPRNRRLRDLDVSSFSAVLEVIKAHKISVVVVGPEQLLVDGLSDYLAEMAPEVKFFGPSKLAAELEGSKIFMKTRCKRWNIPTAPFDFAADYGIAERILKNTNYYVVKADGLCAGKGVVVAHNEAEALTAAKDMLVGRIFGKAGEKIVLEAKLNGVECSVMALCDGVQALPLAVARDYKRAYDNDEGPNTGGMGAYSPVPDVDAELLAQIKREILDKMVEGMRKEGRSYHGVMYAGIMVTAEGPMLLEVNCRFGDPETQVVLPRLKSDLLPLLLATTHTGGLSSIEPPQWHSAVAVAKVIVSGEYPGKCVTGFPIKGIEDAMKYGCRVYHAGTDFKDGDWVTAGGRVLNVVAVGHDFAKAKQMVDFGANRIEWPNSRSRSDIAANLLI